MSDFAFSLICPHGELLACRADRVVAPGVEGEFGVLPRHAPFVSALRTGLIRVAPAEKDQERRFLVRDGFAEVAADQMTVLTNDATDLSDATPEQIETELQKLAAAKENSA